MPELSLAGLLSSFAVGGDVIPSRVLKTRSLVSGLVTVTRSRQVSSLLMFTVFDHDDVAQRAIRAGADGFLLKTASPEEICGGIRNVAGGLGAVSPKTASQLFTQVREDPRAAERAEAARLVGLLTNRERDVIAGVARGLSNAELARELYVSQTTVKTHLQSAMSKVGAENRVQLGILADRAGMRNA